MSSKNEFVRVNFVCAKRVRDAGIAKVHNYGRGPFVELSYDTAKQARVECKLYKITMHQWLMKQCERQ